MSAILNESASPRYTSSVMVMGNELELIKGTPCLLHALYALHANCHGNGKLHITFNQSELSLYNET